MRFLPGDWRHGASAASIQAQALTQQVKTLTRQTFGTLPACSFAAQANPAATTNYQDLWWAAGGLESGWGLNLTHQGATIFATWFTYDTDGTPLWLSATLSKGVGESFSGALVKTAGPAFNAVPFDPNAVTRTTVGNGITPSSSAGEPRPARPCSAPSSRTRARWSGEASKEPSPRCARASCSPSGGAASYGRQWARPGTK